MGEQGVDVLVDRLALRLALGFPGLHERLRAAEDRRRPKARAVVHAEDGEVVSVELERRRQREASSCERSRIGSSHGQHRRVQRLEVDETHPVRVVEERRPDVAARGATLRVVLRCDVEGCVVRSAGIGDRIDEELQRLIGRGGPVVRRSVVVLDLLERNHIRRIQVVRDLPAQHRGLCRVGAVRRQVEDVVGRNSQVTVILVDVGRLRLEIALLDDDDLVDGVQLEVAEAVPHHTGDVVEPVSDLDRRQVEHVALVERAARKLDLESLGILVTEVVRVRLQEDALASGPQVVGLDDVLVAVVGDGEHFGAERAELTNRRNGAGLLHLHEHAFERLVEVDGVLIRVEVARIGLQVHRQFVVADHDLVRCDAAVEPDDLRLRHIPVTRFDDGDVREGHLR